MGFRSGSTQALLRLYSGSTQALLRLYSASAQDVLRTYCVLYHILERKGNDCVLKTTTQFILDLVLDFILLTTSTKRLRIQLLEIAENGFHYILISSNRKKGVRIL